MIKLMIVDDSQIVINGLKYALSKYEDIEVVLSANDGLEAISLINDDVDLILMDIQMPLMDGIKATKELIKINPNIKILIMTSYQDDRNVYEALSNGAKGFLLKDSDISNIYHAINAVYNNFTVMDPNLVLNLKSSNDISKYSLSETEMEILELISEGKNNNEIADVLFLSSGTIRNYVSNILSKLDLKDRTQLAIFYLKNK